MPPKEYPRQSALSLLLPSFRVRVEEMLAAMKKRGFEPLVWETLRTPERAEMLSKEGKSKNGARSMHVSADGFSAAVDVICAKRKWEHPEFFKALGEEARKLGLSWGGDWATFKDLPHVQAIAVKEQAAFRALKTALEKDAFVQRVLEKSRPNT